MRSTIWRPATGIPLSRKGPSTATWRHPGVADDQKHFLNLVVRICIGDLVDVSGASHCHSLRPLLRGPGAVGRTGTSTISRVLEAAQEVWSLHGPLADDPTARVLHALLLGMLCWTLFQGMLIVPFYTATTPSI